jgi:hypothetical protein
MAHPCVTVSLYNDIRRQVVIPLGVPLDSRLSHRLDDCPLGDLHR